jgi:selenium-binding protein 1
VTHELAMPNVGDELHHCGWNRCGSACHGPDRSHLIVPGFRSSRIYVVSVADDPRRPQLEKVIEAEEIIRETGLTRPHTVHCMPGDNVVISMLGDAEGTVRAASPPWTRRPSSSRAAGKTGASVRR